MPGKRYLMAPGPTPVPPEVLAASAEPVLHHRGPDFREVMKRCLGRLQEVARTQNDLLLFTASGTGAFESAVVNLLSPGERVLVVTAGEFGDRWVALARAYGADDAAGPVAGDDLTRRVGALRAHDDAALLLRLGEAPRAARGRLNAVHAGRLARRRSRCRPGAPARGGPRVCVRAARRARPGLSRGRQGDGARAVLAGRGALRDRHRDPHARGRRRARGRARAARPVRDHGRRRARRHGA